jgi:hypothetical protein
MARPDGRAHHEQPRNERSVVHTVPTFTWQETHYLDDINMAAYYELTGKVNNAEFRGFAAGEVLCMPPTGQKRGPYGKWEVTFKFASSPNRIGITVGQIIGINKGGWEYMWIRYGESVDPTSHTRIKKPVGVYVEQVYESGDFSFLGIGD